MPISVSVRRPACINPYLRTGDTQYHTEEVYLKLEGVGMRSCTSKPSVFQYRQVELNNHHCATFSSAASPLSSDSPSALGTTLLSTITMEYDDDNGDDDDDDTDKFSLMAGR